MSAPLLVAFSGGGDSTALLVRALALGGPVIAAILDHGLQAGSAAAAARASAIGAELGATPIVRRLSGLAPTQSAARRARYAALADIARDLGVGQVLLGHTLDDQAETVLMRAARGAGPRGLAGMAAMSWCGVWPEGRDLALSRPLLGQPREALRAALIAAGVPWMEDPANTHPRYDRTHARAALAGQEGQKARLAALAARLRRVVDAEAQAAAACFAIDGRVDAEGASIGLGAYRALPRPVQVRLLGAMIAAASGAARAPSGAALTRLAIAAGANGFQGATLAGARVRHGAQSRLCALRDPGAAYGRHGQSPVAPMPLAVGRPTVLDGRFELIAQRPGLSAALDTAPNRRCGLALHSQDGDLTAGDLKTWVSMRPLAPVRLARMLTPPAPPPHPLTPL